MTLVVLVQAPGPPQDALPGRVKEVSIRLALFTLRAPTPLVTMLGMRYRPSPLSAAITDPETSTARPVTGAGREAVIVVCALAGKAEISIKLVPSATYTSPEESTATAEGAVNPEPTVTVVVAVVSPAVSGLTTRAA